MNINCYNKLRRWTARSLRLSVVDRLLERMGQPAVVFVIIMRCARSSEVCIGRSLANDSVNLSSRGVSGVQWYFRNPIEQPILMNVRSPNSAYTTIPTAACALSIA